MFYTLEQLWSSNLYMFWLFVCIVGANLCFTVASFAKNWGYDAVIGACFCALWQNGALWFLAHEIGFAYTLHTFLASILGTVFCAWLSKMDRTTKIVFIVVNTLVVFMLLGLKYWR